MQRLICLLLVLALAFPLPLAADTRPAPEDRGVSGLALALRRLQTIASVLHTGAHPDDESTELLAYTARGHGARVAYLSLNRGEGGQNGIGPELGENLGILRTEELLAARKLDGAEQYFTRAFDFGFTRSADETLRKWNQEEILSDMVRVIRSVRPLVVVNGFSGTARDGHGQHQVAGMLTPEAIKAAADPMRFPEQIKDGLQPWRALKVYGRIFGSTQGPAVTFDVGKLDPILGRSYAELAAEGRSKHRSQDFGMIQPRGSQTRTFPRFESAVEVPMGETSLFTGLDTSILGIAKFASRDHELLLPALKKIQDAAARALREFHPEEPRRIASHLAFGLHEVRSLRSTLKTLDPISRVNVDALLERKEQEFSDALIKAHGVIVDAFSNLEIVTPGESTEVTINVYFGLKNGSESESSNLDTPQIRLTASDKWKIQPLLPEAEQPPSTSSFRRLHERADAMARFRVSVPADELPTEPYWLVRERTRDQFDWDEKMPRTLPFTPPRLMARVDIVLAGEPITITQPVEYRFSDKAFGEIRRELKVVPELTVTMHPSLLVIPTGSANQTREISVEITHHARHATNGSIRLEAPAGWSVETVSQPFAFSQPGEKIVRIYRVTPPPNTQGSFQLRAIATANNHEYTRGYMKIAYPHIETHFVYRAATAKAELFDVKVAPELKVGYIMGSGDDIPEALTQLGVNVNSIGEVELATGDLSLYDTIILGIRAYEVRGDVIANNKRLLDYVASGGTLIVQYNKLEFGRGNFAPYPVKMDGNQRITDEAASIDVLMPGHSVFNFPNRITAADWQGWVQERGLYFLTEWDARYTPLLAALDENGRKLAGGELIAQVGKGNYIFTAYAWFRQLPAGVPGAYRLFANLISLPKVGIMKSVKE